MRRIAAKKAKPGMVLSRPVYDSSGLELYELGATLADSDLAKLEIYGISELLIDDPRVADVPVQPLIAPEIEADVVRSLRELLTESRSAGCIDEQLVMQVERSITKMCRELFPDVMGEVNASGCHSLDDYDYVQPVKAAGLSILMGRRQGLSLKQLTYLGLAAALMNGGYILLPSGLPRKKDPLTPQEERVFRLHPQIGVQQLEKAGGVAEDTSTAIMQHHERWDGTGYPSGLQAEQISINARIIAIADTYYEMVSKRPDRKPYMPHEAIEFIMAYSGDLFDPDLVEIFSRQMPLYPTGVTVKLNTGEMAIVSDANLGFIGRPVVRMCTTDEGKPLDEPYDLDLAEPENQDRLVASVMDY